MRFVGILLIIASLPAFIALLRANPKTLKYVYFAIGAAPLSLSLLNVDASFYNLANVTYYSKGLVVTLLDTLCLAILLTTAKPLRKLPFVGLFVFYIVAICLSVFQADGFMASFSYAFQLMRVFVVFAAVANIVQRPGAIKYIAFGMAASVMIQGVLTIGDRAGGSLQASGSLGHQNLLGMMLHFITLPLLALLMAGNKSKLMMAGVAAGLLAVALGASRGSIGFLGLGIAIMFVLSLARHTTSRKFSIIGFSLVVMVATSPIVYAGLQERFTTINNSGDYDERAAFERAANLMWDDYPMGVGANRYTIVAITEGYSERAGVAWAYGSRSAKVHNLFLLTAAETGWPGLIAILGLFIWPIVRGLQFAFSNRRDPRGDIVLGSTAACIILVFHCLYEWVFVLSMMQYIYAINLGMMAGLIRQRSREANAAKLRKLRPGTGSAHQQDEPEPVIAGLKNVQ